MNVKNAFYMILLAALWGASFLFMRVGAPSLGSIWLIALRVGFAALFLFFVVLFWKKKTALLEHWKHYLFLGSLSVLIPFLCYGFGAHYLSASVMSIVNGLTPIFGTFISATYFRIKLSANHILGLALGFIGVAMIVGFDAGVLQNNSWFAVMIVMLAPICYGISSTYMQVQVEKNIHPIVNTYGSMLMASLIIAPFLFFITPASPEDISWLVMLSATALGVLSTGVAFLIFFRLLSEVGIFSTLAVTFLIPVFGVLWGVLFLEERVGLHTLCGAVLVVVGTIKITGFSLKSVTKPE